MKVVRQVLSSCLLLSLFNGFCHDKNTISFGVGVVHAKEAHTTTTTTTLYNYNVRMDEAAAAGGENNNSTANPTSSLSSTASAAAATATTTSSVLTPLKTTTAKLVKVPHRLFRQIKHSVWESLDEMDRLIVTTALPIATLFCILPLVNAADVFWVSRLGDTLAVAAQQAGNQIYMTVFFLMNFLPSITAIQVSKSFSLSDEEATQDDICNSMVVGLFVALIGTFAMFFYPQKFLSSILKEGAPALDLAIPYLRLRSFSCLPMLVSFLGFSAFRGTMDVSSCIKVTVFSSALYMVLDPLMVHVFGLGITGSAITSIICDWFSATNYLKLMTERGMISWKKLTKLPAFKQMAPLIQGSIGLQARSLAMNFGQIFVARKVQSLDDTGVSTAAFVLAMQSLSLGGVVLTALGMATQTLFPIEVESCPTEDRGLFVRALVGRFVKRGAGLGVALSIIQLLLVPGILQSSPLPEVRSTALVPMLIVIGSQALTGIIQVIEGIIMGDGKFTRSSINVIVSTIGYILCLRECPKRFGLAGVFACMTIFTTLRLATSLMYLPVIYKEHDNQGEDDDDDGEIVVPTSLSDNGKEEGSAKGGVQHGNGNDFHNPDKSSESLLFEKAQKLDTATTSSSINKGSSSSGSTDF
mmetsp:Transcript_20941/g.49740  ORF Transcript_20941/g.49740 Transcript_20941/m.49740 type:complete len:640 (+) Transcript_20941:191-2110(+)